MDMVTYNAVPKAIKSQWLGLLESRRFLIKQAKGKTADKWSQVQYLVKYINQTNKRTPKETVPGVDCHSVHRKLTIKDRKMGKYISLGKKQFGFTCQTDTKLFCCPNIIILQDKWAQPIQNLLLCKSAVCTRSFCNGRRIEAVSCATPTYEEYITFGINCFLWDLYWGDNSSL